MIYLARLGKCFGPFSADELASTRIEDYSWILDLRDAQPGWQPIDRPPTMIPVSSGEKRPLEALIYSRQAGGAVSGTLEQVRLRTGILMTEESRIRLEPGSVIEVQVAGRPAFPATIERVEYSDRKARYSLSWQPVHAPG